MVLPRWLAKVNRRFTNRILQRIPARISPFVTIRHVGRKTGVGYATLLAAFRTPTGYVLTPTYGPDADWVRNVLASGNFNLQANDEVHSLRNARLINRSEAWPHLPLLVRVAMRVLRVDWYVAADND